MTQQMLKQNASSLLSSESIRFLPDAACPNCGSHGLSVFYEVQNVPVHSCLMLSSAEDALDFPSGDVELALCETCGFITNTLFDAKWSAYAPNYEDQQSFSPTFNRFAKELAQQLIDKYDLHNKSIVEIGCSKGDFLHLLCELGNNTGVGIDPSAVPGRVSSTAADRVMLIQDYYSEKYAEHVGDFICCRHTLEHIQPTAEFISTVRRSIGDRPVSVVFEIPETVRVLEDAAFEDIYYEHCSYFTPGSLARLFRSCGFEVTDLYRAYGDQYLLIDARPVAMPSEKIHPLEDSPAQISQSVQTFVDQIQGKLDGWKSRLETAQQEGKKVVVWGSGSKCVAFLTTLATIDKIQYVVDINPHRHGKFIPGVGKQIMSPAFLQEYQPDLVIVMNEIYCDEIGAMLKDMGVTPEIVAL